jgi:GMP synthase-like glutamine amidotransferase
MANRHRGDDMKVRVLQHVSFEDIGSMGPWLKTQGAEINYTRLYSRQDLPDASGENLIIVMGGPMSVNDETEYPWLRPEKQFIFNAIQRGIPVLGVCLGAQLIASALGCRVYRNMVKEIGWLTIESTNSAVAAFQFPQKCTVFHWHGETFDLPSGAVHLARSEGCENQAFQYKQNVIGLQFHLETTPDSLRAIVDNCSYELVPAQYIQSKSQLLSSPKEAYAEINVQMERVLTYLTRAAG